MLPLEHYWPSEMLARVLPEQFGHLSAETPSLREPREARRTADLAVRSQGPPQIKHASAPRLAVDNGDRLQRGRQERAEVLFVGRRERRGDCTVLWAENWFRTRSPRVRD